MNYLWLDLETTGLDPYTDDILEVGMRVTDSDLVSLTHVPGWLIPPRRDWLVTTEDHVIDMHVESGLLEEQSDEFWMWHSRLAEVEAWTLKLIEPYLTEGKITLAGSGVATFDMRFIREQMPELAQRLNYWTLDIGVVRRFLSDVCGVLLPELGPVRHRALDDVEHHLLEARTYRTAFVHYAWGLGDVMHR